MVHSNYIMCRKGGCLGLDLVISMVIPTEEGGLKEAREEKNNIIISGYAL